MLTDILNSVIYLLTAQLLHLGGCLIADVKLRTRNDPELLEWYITPVDMEITRELLLINLVYNTLLGIGALVTPKYKPLTTH